MRQIRCPHCGLRDETEFRFGGPASVLPHPRAGSGDSDDSDDSDDITSAGPSSDAVATTWAADHYGWPEAARIPAAGGIMRLEWWGHVDGCGAWFRIRRDWVTGRIGAEAGE